MFVINKYTRVNWFALQQIVVAMGRGVVEFSTVCYATAITLCTRSEHKCYCQYGTYWQTHAFYAIVSIANIERA